MDLNQNAVIMSVRQDRTGSEKMTQPELSPSRERDKSAPLSDLARRSGERIEGGARPGANSKSASVTIRQIRRDLKFHRGIVLGLRAKMERLLDAAFTELAELKQLRDIIERLRDRPDGPKASSETGGTKDAAVLPGVEIDQEKRKKTPWECELAQLLKIEELLESTLPDITITQATSAGDVPSGGPRKILIVDDDPTTVKILAHFLEREDFEVCTADSGRKGIGIALSERPDLILLDIMMPELNGFQFLALLKKDKNITPPPVILLSMLAEESHILQGLEKGAADYLTKPFSPHILLAKIRKLLTRVE